MNTHILSSSSRRQLNNNLFERFNVTFVQPERELKKSAKNERRS